MFFKRDSDETSSSTSVKDDAPSVEPAPAAAPKGRPTPSRKEAEAARKAALTGAPKPGSSKKATKQAQREQAREMRIKNREAMMRGDDRALPARDQGPVKKAVRDYVDSRRTVAEFFVPVAVVVLLLGLMRNVQVQVFVTMVWFLILFLVVTDTAIMLWRMNRKLAETWPNKADRKSINFYAVMRGLQIRRLRLPPPRFKAGGRPIPPKK